MSTPWSRIAPARRELLESLVTEYAHHYAKGRTILAVDGPDGAGKTRFADDLAMAFERAGFTRAADTDSVLNGFPRVLMRLNLR